MLLKWEQALVEKCGQRCYLFNDAIGTATLKGDYNINRPSLFATGRD